MTNDPRKRLSTGSRIILDLFIFKLPIVGLIIYSAFLQNYITLVYASFALLLINNQLENYYYIKRKQSEQNNSSLVERGMSEHLINNITEPYEIMIFDMKDYYHTVIFLLSTLLLLFKLSFLILIKYFIQEAESWLNYRGILSDCEIYIDRLLKTDDILKTFLPNAAVVIAWPIIIYFSRKYTPKKADIEEIHNKRTSRDLSFLLRLVILCGIGMLPFFSISLIGIFFIILMLVYFVIRMMHNPEEEKLTLGFYVILKAAILVVFILNYATTVTTFKTFEGTTWNFRFIGIYIFDRFLSGLNVNKKYK
jgi:hypothetical protein